MSQRRPQPRPFSLFSFHALLTTISASLLFSSAILAATIRTIDDFYGDPDTGLKPQYGGSWNFGPSCTGCLAKPDTSLTYDQTWHEVTVAPTDSSPRNITLTFNGTAISVYGVVPNYVEYATTFVNVSFELDGKTVGLYTHVPNTSTNFAYNVTLYSNTVIPNGQHTLIMTPQRQTNESFLVFDWAEYTYEDFVGPSSSGTPSPTSTTGIAPNTDSRNQINTTAIVGGVIGGVVALTIIVIVGFFYHRRRQHGGLDKITIIGNTETGNGDVEPNAARIDPFMDPSMSQAHAFGLSTTIRRFEAHGSTASSSAMASTSIAPTSASANVSHFTNAPSTISENENSTTAVSSSDPSTNAGLTKSDSALYVLPAEGASVASSTQLLPQADATSERRLPPLREGRKATMRREELSRQMRDIEQTVADLRRRQSSQSATSPRSGRPVSDVPPMPESPEAGAEGNDDSELRRQIEVLQMEVERLQAEQVMMAEPPPAYEPAEDDADAERGRLLQH